MLCVQIREYLEGDVHTILRFRKITANQPELWLSRPGVSCEFGAGHLSVESSALLVPLLHLSASGKIMLKAGLRLPNLFSELEK